MSHDVGPEHVSGPGGEGDPVTVYGKEEGSPLYAAVGKDEVVPGSALDRDGEYLVKEGKVAPVSPSAEA